MTPDELKTRVYPRLLRKYIRTATWNDVVAAFQGASQADKDKVVVEVQNQNISALGRAVGKVILNHIRAEADAEASIISQDVNLTQAELEQIYD